MEIGKEADQPVEYPEPLAPGQTPVHEPSPVVEPAKEPAHALFGGKPLTEIQAEIMDEIALQVSMSERDTWARCDRG